MTYEQEKIKPYNNKERKKEQVERMFDNIAPTYDRLNHTLSLGIDRNWRRKAILWLKPFNPQRVLDISTGTGDFAFLIRKLLAPKEIIGADISREMMAVGKAKAEKMGVSDSVHFEQEDCMEMSYPDCSFDAVTVAFGVRNFEDLDKGLREMHRVLTPKGHLVILELSQPTTFPMKQLFYIYSKIVMPLIGRLISGDKSAYTYLPDTIRVFPQGEVMQEIITKAGFSEVSFRRFTFGICTFYMATK